MKQKKSAMGKGMTESASSFPTRAVMILLHSPMRRTSAQVLFHSLCFYYNSAKSRYTASKEGTEESS